LTPHITARRSFSRWRNFEINTPEWTKPGIYGAIIGAVIVAVAGFSWGGWMTAGSARELANKTAHDRVVAALVPVCVEMSRVDTDRAAKLATIRAATSYQQRSALMEAGWATVPGSDEPDRDLAQACLASIEDSGS
jgi:hypothetical protein